MENLEIRSRNLSGQENSSDYDYYFLGRNELPGMVFLRDIAWLFILLYSLVFIVGSIGNALLVGTVIRYKSLQNVTNFFIANLAASDFVMCIFCIPWSLAQSLMDDWIFGETMCRFIPMVQAVSVYVSVLSHMVIAIDRYFAIMHPLKTRLTLTSCFCVLAVTWIFGFCLASPIGVYTHQFDLRSFGFGIACFEFWPSPSRRLIYSISLLLIQYVIPLVVVTSSYRRMSLNLNRRVAPGVITDEQEYRETRRKQKTNRLLVAVVASFALSWLPFNVFMVLNDTNINLIDKRYFNVMFTLCHLIAMTSTCYNPFIYAWLHPNFREKFKSKMQCCSRRKKSGNAAKIRANFIRENNAVSTDRKSAAVSSEDVETFQSPATQGSSDTTSNPFLNAQSVGEPVVLTVDEYVGDNYADKKNIYFFKEASRRV
ncbi:prolactin-releasing peptide receptor-like [Ptychodera flava]|uniref:prolactin-releasing peptide receptor-like n=1 Tax=Ptychodera flava TaxID=63121 RepID=UPI00396A86B1